jgi:hypothetical protein
MRVRAGGEQEWRAAETRRWRGPSVWRADRGQGRALVEQVDGVASRGADRARRRGPVGQPALAGIWPALAGGLALAGLRAGFSRFALFRKILRELFVDLGGIGRENH